MCCTGKDRIRNLTPRQKFQPNQPVTPKKVAPKISTVPVKVVKEPKRRKKRAKSEEIIIKPEIVQPKATSKHEDNLVGLTIEEDGELRIGKPIKS